MQRIDKRSTSTPDTLEPHNWVAEPYWKEQHLFFPLTEDWIDPALTLAPGKLTGPLAGKTWKFVMKCENKTEHVGLGQWSKGGERVA